MYFDGVDDYVKVLNNPSLFPPRITLEAWINPAKQHMAYEKIMVVSRTVSTIEYTYFLSYDNANHMRFQAYTTYLAQAISTSTMPVGKSTHIVGVYDGSNVYIYINGVLEASAPLTGDLEKSTKNLYLGAREDLSQRFQGLIGGARIYGRGLSQTEIQYNMSYPENPIRDGLVLWLYAHPDYVKDIDGDGILEWIDLSGYGNHGKIYGAQPVQFIKDASRVVQAQRVVPVAR
jgi:hypothetical protein